MTFASIRVIRGPIPRTTRLTDAAPMMLDLEQRRGRGVRVQQIVLRLLGHARAPSSRFPCERLAQGLARA